MHALARSRLDVKEAGLTLSSTPVEYMEDLSQTQPALPAAMG